MKLVFLDMQKRNILIYEEKGIIFIPFDKKYALKQILKNEPVIYVSDAVVTNASEITNLISSLNDRSLQDNYSNIEVENHPSYEYSSGNATSSNEPLYARSVRNGIVFINDMGTKDQFGNISGHQFKGSLDFQPLSYLNNIGFNESQQIHSLINKGIIEIVPQSKINIIKASHINYSPAQTYNKQAYAQKMNKNKNNIIIDSHKSFDNEDNFSSGVDVTNYAGGSFKGTDIIGIDLDKGGISKGGGSLGNEGALIQDF